MKLGYITKENPTNRKAYSGIHFNMHEALKKNFKEVIPLGPVESKYRIVPKMKSRILRITSGKVYKYQYNTTLAKRLSSIIDKRIKNQKPDILLASLMTPEVANLESNLPLFITTDATFPLLNGLYQSHSKLHPKSIQEALHLEKKAFKKAAKLILPLQWLADSAMKDYGISSNKIEVVCYGSNLEAKITKKELSPIIKSRNESSAIKLLFVGVRWEEKGGPFAIEVLKNLLDQGVQAELYIVGCKPELSDSINQIKIIGFLDKETGEDSDKLHQLYREASFFIMPTKAECVGMSFIEAASYGLPAIGTNIGGVPEAVISDQTGFICTKNTNAGDVADWIKKNWLNKEIYKKISLNSYDHYIKKMNWDNWGERTKEIIDRSI